MTGVCALTCPRVPDGLIADSVHRGKFVGAQRAGNYLSHLLNGKAGQWAAPTDPSTLQRFPHVLGVGSRRQVLRLNANRPIATMQNMQSSGYFAVKNLMANPVRVHASVATAVNPSIAVPLQVAPPVPAPVAGWSFWHDPTELLLGRKTVGYWHGEGLLDKHAILRFRHSGHLLTVGRKRAMVNE